MDTLTGRVRLAERPAELDRSQRRAGAHARPHRRLGARGAARRRRSPCRSACGSGTAAAARRPVSSSPTPRARCPRSPCSPCSRRAGCSATRPPCSRAPCSRSRRCSPTRSPGSGRSTPTSGTPRGASACPADAACGRSSSRSPSRSSPPACGPRRSRSSRPSRSPRSSADAASARSSSTGFGTQDYGQVLAGGILVAGAVPGRRGPARARAAPAHPPGLRALARDTSDTPSRRTRRARVTSPGLAEPATSGSNRSGTTS